MGPTSMPVLVLAALLAVAAPATCLLVARLRGGARRRYAVRLGMLVGCQLSVVALAAVAVNDYGQFYPSWAELLGTRSDATAAAPTAHYGADPPRSTPAPTNVGHTLGAPAIPAAAATWTATSWSPRPSWPQRGAIVATTVTGSASRLSEKAYVYLPPGYFHSGPAARSMPVVEVLTGYPGTAANLFTRLDYPDRLLTELHAGLARDMVLVMLQPAATFPWDTECTDVPGGPQALRFFTTDVPHSVTAQFELRPTGWGTIGDSTGGYCAAKIAMFAPERFHAAVSLSGYYSPATDWSTRGLFSGRPRLRQSNDLLWRLEHLPAPPVSLLVATARDERGPDGYAVNERWLRAVRPPMSADELALEHGGHNFVTWGREIPYALRWLSGHLA